MGCFIAPMTEAVVTTIATKFIEKREIETGMTVSASTKELWSTRLHRLNKMLWGGSALLAFEHVWHGELQPFFPFLTAAADAESTAMMLHEIATTGVMMALLVTAVWGVSCFVVDRVRKNATATETKEA